MAIRDKTQQEAQSLQIKALYKIMFINKNSILTTIHQLQEKIVAQLNQPAYFLKHLNKMHNRMCEKYKQIKLNLDFKQHTIKTYINEELINISQ